MPTRLHSLHIHDAGTLAYRPAWDLQLQVHERVLTGELAHGAIILVEHLPVITLGRRLDARKNLLASPAALAARGVDLVETDRGGDITFHGPGQLVAYPVIPLNRYNLNLHAYMRLMEEAVIQTLATWDIRGERSEGATGVWTDPVVSPAWKGAGRGAHSPMPAPAKVCAMGIKVRKWVTLHGLALNVTTDMSFFDLINPCGLGRPVTSMRHLLGDGCPPMDAVKARLVNAFEGLLGELAQTPSEA
jgi:lipoate-protein ligase B